MVGVVVVFVVVWFLTAAEFVDVTVVEDVDKFVGAAVAAAGLPDAVTVAALLVEFDLLSESGLETRG